jgi:hypothetical protein
VNHTSVAPNAKLSVAIDNTELINGSSSLQLSLTSGNDGRLDSGVYRWFAAPLNLSSKFISFYVYGSGQHGQIQIIFSSDSAQNSYNNIAQWAVLDDFEGWKHIQLPLSAPQQEFGLWNDSQVSGILIKYFDESQIQKGPIDIRLNEIAITTLTTLNEVPQPKFSPLDVIDISPTYAPTKYILNVTSPCELIFLDNFDLNWHAYINDKGGFTHELQHDEVLNWSNAFNVSGEGETQVLLIYQPQTNRDNLLLVWSIVAPLAILGPIFYNARAQVFKIKPVARKLVYFVRGRFKNI